MTNHDDDQWAIEDEPLPELEPEAAAAAITDAFARMFQQQAAEPLSIAIVEPEPPPVLQILPADFELPKLIRFVPSPALRTQADEAASYALSLTIAGADGAKRGDAACGALRGALKALETHFDEPKTLAHQLHKHITSTLADWSGPAKNALEVVGRRVATETRRLEQEAAERRRRAQEEQDKLARAYAQEEVAAAQAAQAPAAVVEELQRQAETATAPPVNLETAAPRLAHSSAVAIWKARLVGTSGEADPNPRLEDMTREQRNQMLELLGAIMKGTHPLVGIEVDWAYWNKRAKSDKSALSAPGIEAFEDLGLRGRSSRTKRS